MCNTERFNTQSNSLPAPPAQLIDDCVSADHDGLGHQAVRAATWTGFKPLAPNWPSFPEIPLNRKIKSRRAKIKTSWAGLSFASHRTHRNSHLAQLADGDTGCELPQRGHIFFGAQGSGFLCALPFAIPGLVAAKCLMT